MILQRDGSPGHSLHSIYDFCLLSAGIWRGEQKAAKTKPFLGSPWQQVGAQRSQSIAHQYRSSAELSIVHSAAPGRDLCCALGNRESFGNRARQPKGCAAETAAAPA